MAMDEFRTRKMMEDAAEFEAGRVARERAFKREMQGTFQQNADLKRQVEGTFAGRDASQRAIHGTWDQRNKAAFDLQRIQDDAANWRTITADATARRGQDLEMRASTLHDTTARRGQDLQQDQALMQNATTRRGHDIQRDIHGWSYQTVKDYDPQTGFVTGEHIEPWRHGERVQQNGGGQTSAPRWAGVKPDKHFNDYMDSLTPEQRNVAYRQIFESGNTALLDHLKNTRKQAAGGQSSLSTTQQFLDSANNTGTSILAERENAARGILTDAGENLSRMGQAMTGGEWRGFQYTAPEMNPRFKAILGLNNSAQPAPVGSTVVRNPIPSPDLTSAGVRKPIPSPGVTSTPVRRSMPSPNQSGTPMTRVRRPMPSVDEPYFR